ncbi:sigma 54-interacting transcriptional regulator [bacterium]|nr:sigma 54-interacting transcriptional regulator [bacterium]
MLLLVADCFGRTIQFPLTDDYQEVMVRSLPESHIYLPYKGVSRCHFSLTRIGNDWILTDSGSTNGTRLNGVKIEKSIIKPNDLIHVGIVELKVLESDVNRLIRIPAEEAESGKADRTDRVSALEPALKGSIFVSRKLVFPDGMIPGKSSAMMSIYQQMHSLAESDVSVLLIGETGTGKEMFARMLHASGKRASGPFIVVNSAAIPAELFEAELFGIGEKVATDVSKRKGKFELAHEGTFFLDELGAFPIACQAKLLRSLEEKAITRIGEHHPIKVDFRLISAMNEDPQELIQSGRLREDLYHRLTTVELLIPPLRERRDDIPGLILGTLRQISKKEKKPIAGISKQLFSLLAAYSYPGNIRELVNLLSSIVALAHPGEILDLHLAPGKLLQQGANKSPASDPDLAEDSIDLRGQMDALSRKLVLRALNLHDWNMTDTAKSLRITRFGLRKMMKRLNIPTKENSQP